MIVTTFKVTRLLLLSSEAVLSDNSTRMCRKSVEKELLDSNRVWWAVLGNDMLKKTRIHNHDRDLVTSDGEFIPQSVSMKSLHTGCLFDLDHRG